MYRVAGAVLAAGAGTRMGTAKAGLVVGGRSLLDRAIAALHDGGCADVVAVVRDGQPVAGARRVVNEHPELGLRSSLQVAIDAAGDAADEAAGDGVDALAVLLVDQPGITADGIRAVVGAWRPGRIALASYRAGPSVAVPGHPVVMSLPLWRQALSLAGPDEGARALLQGQPHLVDRVPAPGVATDLDTPDQLRRWTTELAFDDADLSHP